MEVTNHPLGLTVLEVKDTVEGYEGLNPEVIQKLMATEAFGILTPSLQRRALGQVTTSASSLVAEVSGAALLVTNQWIVSIYGDSLAHCIEAFMRYRNAVATVLAATVIGNLQTPVVENSGPLNALVIRREKRRQFRSVVDRAGWMLAAAVAGVALTMIVNVLVGG